MGGRPDYEQIRIDDSGIPGRRMNHSHISGANTPPDRFGDLLRVAEPRIIDYDCTHLLHPLIMIEQIDLEVVRSFNVFSVRLRRVSSSR